MSTPIEQIKDLYDKGINIIKFINQTTSSPLNSTDAILISYDMQAGSYVERLKSQEAQEYDRGYYEALIKVLAPLSPQIVMEAGVGEATIFSRIMDLLPVQPKQSLGFDISWSRIKYAREYSAQFNIDARLFVGNLLQIPLVDNSCDVVYTCHSIEPNGGREKQVLQELYRVTNHWLVLVEPTYELGNQTTKEHIIEHGYCRDLHIHAKQLGYNIVEYRLFEKIDPRNQAALLVIEKPIEAAQEPNYGCPNCRTILILHRGHYFCVRCSLIYPVIDETPCLLASDGILGSKYLE